MVLFKYLKEDRELNISILGSTTKTFRLIHIRTKRVPALRYVEGLLSAFAAQS